MFLNFLDELRAAGIPHQSGGVQAAMDYLSGNA